MATVRGFVEKIKFRNEDNGYTVLSVADGNEEYILVGIFHYISAVSYTHLDVYKRQARRMRKNAMMSIISEAPAVPIVSLAEVMNRLRWYPYLRRVKRQFTH